MPRGNHISKTHLEMIWHHRVILERNPAEIWLNVFQSDVNLISLRYLRSMCRSCDSGLEDERFNGVRAKRSGGPKVVVDVVAEGFLLDIFLQEKQVRQEKAREKFLEEYYGVVIGGPSIRTIGRVLKRCNMTRKVMQRVHHLRCPSKLSSWSLQPHFTFPCS